jgi:hypothetical protein
VYRLVRRFRNTRTPLFMLIFVVILGFIALILACVFLFPQILIAFDVGSKAARQLKPAELIDARNKARASSLQALQVGGALFVLATAFLKSFVEQVDSQAAPRVIAVCR